jgi:hypothetical protein
MNKNINKKKSNSFGVILVIIMIVGVMLFGFLGAIVPLYFLPMLIANSKSHDAILGISLVNILFGWTLLGWIASLIWSFSEKKPIIINTNSTSSADEIIKLSNLKEKGIISENEFEQQKRKIIESE